MTAVYFRWHYFFSTNSMKTICYTVSVLLFLTWALTIFIFHGSYVAHTLVFIAVIALLHGIITAPKKIQREIEEQAILPR